MSLRLRLLIACSPLLVSPLAGCGGSSHPLANSLGTASASATTTSAGSSKRTKIPTTSPPRPATRSATSSNVRLPATFAIGSGGGLSPPSVTAPAGVPIELTLVSKDERPHEVVLRAPQRRTLSIAASGRAAALLSGLKAGRYLLEVDGAARGALVIGGQPGP